MRRVLVLCALLFVLTGCTGWKNLTPFERRAIILGSLMATSDALNAVALGMRPLPPPPVILTPITCVPSGPVIHCY